MSRPSNRFALLAVLLLLAVLAVLVLHAFAYDFVSDDAFIVARYARNVVRGAGWVYNEGERVEGYTSFLWVGLTAAGGALGLDLVWMLRGMSLLAACGAAAWAYRSAPAAGIPAGDPCALLAPVLLAASGSFACWALGGLETTAYAFCLLLAVARCARPAASAAGSVTAGLAAGACGLLRPEGALLGALLVASWWWPGAGVPRARRLLGSGLWATILCAHLLWRRQYYGAWLPNTFHAKVGFTAGQLQDGLAYAGDAMAAHGGLVTWLVPLAAPWLLAGGRFPRLASLACLALLGMVVMVGGDGLPMHRFLVPVLPLWAILVGFLLHRIARSVADRGAGPRRGVRAALALAVLALASSLALPRTDSVPFIRYREHARLVPGWRAAGEWLRDSTAPDASLACVPIGAVGYYSDRRLHDMLGLTDRHIARKDVDLGGGWAGHEKHDGPYILSRKPTYLLLGNVQVLDERLPTDHPLFNRPPSAAIRQRESDLFIPEMLAAYQPRVVQLASGQFLHFLERREKRRR